MRWLWIAIELCVEALAAFTLAVHACIAVGAPAFLAWPAFAIALASLAALSRGRFAGIGSEERASAFAALGVGAVFAAVSLVLSTPSGDDFDFFHRALWQLDHLREPFARSDTAFAASGLGAISPLHALTTWEHGVAMSARVLGLDPLGAYHNGAIAIAQLALACVLVLFLRELGFGARAAAVGAIAAFAFLLVDDPSLRSFGIAWRMLWVGKMVQWLLVIPAALLFSLRYARAPSWRALVHPVLCGVCAIGTSGTGVFLLPGVFAAASLAMLARSLRERIDAGAWLRAASLNAGSIYCVGVALLVAAGVLAAPADVRAWTEPFPDTWLANLALTFGHAPGALRNAVLAIGVPALALRGDARSFLVGYALALAVLFTNPIAGPIWLEAAQPGAYWRVMMLFPVPLGAALAAAALAQHPRSLRALGTAALAIAVTLAARATEPPVSAVIAHRYATKSPLALRLPPDDVAFLAPLRAELAGRRLLAGQGIATSAALLVPSLRLEAARFMDTRHAFANAQREDEGLVRLAAWRWASSCEVDENGARAAAQLVRDGVDALIVRDCGSNARRERDLARVLEAAGERSFAAVARDHGYALFLRR